MDKQFSLASIFLWLFVIVLGIELGAGLYETLVVLPTWSSAPPESVVTYFRLNEANPSLVLNAGGRFWIIFTPLVGLLAVAALVTGLKTPAQHRKWRIVGTVLALIVVLTTFAWFVPNLILLMSEEVTRMSGEQITSLTNWWVRLNWIRVVFYVSAWLASLRAFSIPLR